MDTCRIISLYTRSPVNRSSQRKLEHCACVSPHSPQSSPEAAITPCPLPRKSPPFLGVAHSWCFLLLPRQASSSWCPCAERCMCTSTSHRFGRRSSATTTSCTTTQPAPWGRTTHCSTRSSWCNAWTWAPKRICTTRARWYCQASGPCGAQSPAPTIHTLKMEPLGTDVQ